MTRGGNHPTNDMRTCGTCLHLSRWHRLGGCRVAAGCSCIEFTESVIRRYRPDGSWMGSGRYLSMHPRHSKRPA